MNTTTQMTLRPFLIASISLLLGVLYIYLFFRTSLGINFLLFIGTLVICGIWLSRVHVRTITSAQYALVALGLFFGGMVFVRASELLTFFNVMGTFLLLLLAIDLYAGKVFASYTLRDFANIPFLPFRFIGTSFATFPLLFASSKRLSVNTQTKEIVRGSVMAILALVVFSWLFSGADATFANAVGMLFDIELDEEFVGRSVQTLVVTTILFGTFVYMFTDHTRIPTADAVRGFGVLETKIVLSSINVLFFIFIVLQASMLFGGATHLASEGLTYATYARTGFFQLIVVALISFGIILTIAHRIVHHERVYVRSFVYQSGVLVLQVVVILISAHMRLSLYEEAYGFTTIRLYSHALMVWIAVALFLLAYHIWHNSIQKHFPFHMFCSVVVFLVGMNIFNPDAFIAQRNLERYRATGIIDTGYLASLSDDALPHTIRLLSDPKEDVRMSYAYSLYTRQSNCMQDDCPLGARTTWKSERLAYMNARVLLLKRKDTIDAGKNYSPVSDTRMQTYE